MTEFYKGLYTCRGQGGRVYRDVKVPSLTYTILFLTTYHMPLPAQGPEGTACLEKGNCVVGRRGAGGQAGGGIEIKVSPLFSASHSAGKVEGRDGMERLPGNSWLSFP